MPSVTSVLSVPPGVQRWTAGCYPQRGEGHIVALRKLLQRRSQLQNGTGHAKGGEGHDVAPSQVSSAASLGHALCWFLQRPGRATQGETAGPPPSCRRCLRPLPAVEHRDAQFLRHGQAHTAQRGAVHAKGGEGHDNAVFLVSLVALSRHPRMNCRVGPSMLTLPLPPPSGRALRCPVFAAWTSSHRPTKEGKATSLPCASPSAKSSASKRNGSCQRKSFSWGSAR